MKFIYGFFAGFCLVQTAMAMPDVAFDGTVTESLTVKTPQSFNKTMVKTSNGHEKK